MIYFIYLEGRKSRSDRSDFSFNIMTFKRIEFSKRPLFEMSFVVGAKGALGSQFFRYELKYILWAKTFIDIFLTKKTFLHNFSVVSA